MVHVIGSDSSVDAGGTYDQVIVTENITLTASVVTTAGSIVSYYGILVIAIQVLEIRRITFIAKQVIM